MNLSGINKINKYGQVLNSFIKIKIETEENHQIFGMIKVSMIYYIY